MAQTTLQIKDASGNNKNAIDFLDGAGNLSPSHTTDTSVPHYRAGVLALAPLASADVTYVLPGNASTTVRVKRVYVSGAATASGSIVCKVEKCSTAGGLGSAVLIPITAVPLDSGNTAAISTFNSVGTAKYTTVPVPIGVVASGRIMLTAIGGVTTSGNTGATALDFRFDNQALVLRGVAQVMTVSLNGVALLSGEVLDCFVEWSEDAS